MGVVRYGSGTLEGLWGLWKLVGCVNILEMKKIVDYSLYLVSSQEYAEGRGLVDIARAAVSSGVDILQMREKGKSREELMGLGRELVSICSQSDTVFIVNDDPDLAKEVGADGVHLGQEDVEEYPIEKTRSIIGNDRIMGISTHSVEQFERANGSNVDYIAFGPIFSTKTKDYIIGDSLVEKVLDMATKPVVFIGGIDLDNIDTLLEKGAKNIAVIRAIVQAENIPEKVAAFKSKIAEYVPA